MYVQGVAEFSTAFYDHFPVMVVMPKIVPLAIIITVKNRFKNYECPLWQLHLCKLLSSFLLAEVAKVIW